MGCCHYYAETAGNADVFTVEMPRTSFGRGALAELGPRAAARGIARAALFTDPLLARGEHLARARASLAAAGIDVAEFSEVQVEPTDGSCMDAAAFLREAGADGVVSVGGGSTLDTAKAALAYFHHPAEFLTYFAPPVGAGVALPGPVMPHIACPTTGGTGSEMTGLSVIRIGALDTKFVLASRHIMPDEAIIDPACADTLPPTVVAASGFDSLSHALECYTARAYTRWPKLYEPAARPAIQGANPWSDLHAREALRLVGLYLERGVADAADSEARDQLMWAASLAGMAFGNCGTHLPHAMSYGVSHLVRDFRAADYPPGEGPFIPHGISVIVNSPSVFRWTAQAAPGRHLEAAVCLGAEVADAGPEDAGEVVAARIIGLMQGTRMPNGLAGVGFGGDDASALADSCIRQGRAVANAPRDCDRDALEQLYARALSYW
jgi:alcohol dehydrogenase class IV